jgi:cellulose synthase/poly-beta-1,6-N-acetylglucosamine synthase-like glycosyltransferase
MLALALPIFLLYILLIGNYTYHWLKIPVFKNRLAGQQRAFTVVIAARNESDNIGSLLLALQGQQYPTELIEIIVVDDRSTDQTAEIVRKFPQVRLIQVKNESEAGGKKRSLELGIQQANNEWILTTDADCLPRPQWIATINAYLDQENPVCLVGPVSVSSIHGSILQKFQRYDNLMFQGITGAVISAQQHTLGNGANLCYRKDCFEAVGGFNGINQLASGDDVLLIEKFMSTFPGQVQFLKCNSALVNTHAAETWQALWQQRIRWVSKAHAYQGWRLQGAQWITGLFNLILLAQTIYCIVHPADWKTTTSIWMFKALIEWPLIRSVASLYQERRSFIIYLLLQPLHVIYLVSIGIFGQRRQYKWKGRSVH